MTLTFIADDYPLTIGDGKYYKKMTPQPIINLNGSTVTQSESGEIYDEYGDSSEC